MSTPFHFWLEPLSPPTDFERSLRARVADPVWFLTRQWQLGEHQGEDASSPVTVESALPTRRCDMPRAVPTLTYGNSGGTLGRDGTGRLVDHRPPGASWARRRANTRRPVGAEVGGPAFWNASGAIEALAGEIHLQGSFTAGAAWKRNLGRGSLPACRRLVRSGLTHNTIFTAGSQRLEVKDHDGGDLDWFSVDGGGSVGFPVGSPVETPNGRNVLVSRLSYPGAPHPRWWQIEDHAVDIGGFHRTGPT